MARYHITKKGEPGKCTAQPGNCPLGGEGEHYDSPEAARDAFEATQGGSFDQPALFDPREETEYVIAFVKASQLRKGDDYEGSPITSIKVGSKWVTIATEATPKHLVPLDETVAVQREQPTEAAREADHAHYKETTAERAVDRAFARFQAATDRFNEKLTKYGRVDYMDVSEVVETQARKEIAERIKLTAERDGLSYAEATAVVRESYRSNLSDYVIRTGIHRSTNVISNAMEDAKSEAILNFVGDSSYWS